MGTSMTIRSATGIRAVAPLAVDLNQWPAD
jgi:hypothetical protein